MKISSTPNRFFIAAALVVLAAFSINLFFDAGHAQLRSAESAWATFRGDAGLTGRARVASPKIPKPQKISNLFGEVLSPVLADDSTLVYTIFGDPAVYFRNLKSGHDSTYKINSGAVHAPPVAGKDGTVYIGTTTGYLFAINIRNKRRCWALGPEELPGGSITTSVNVGSDNKIFVATDNGFLYVISDEGDHGELHNSPQINPTQVDTTGVPPALSVAGRVYVAHGSRIYVFRNDGEFIQSMPHANAGEFEWVAAGSSLIFAGSKKYPFVVAFNASSNGQVWEFKDQDFGLAKEPAIGANDTLYLVKDNATSGELRILDVKNDKVVRRVHALFTSMPVVDAFGRVFVAANGSPKNTFNGYSITGEVFWSESILLNSNKPLRQSPAFGRDETIYIPGRDELYIIRPEPPNAKRLVHLAGDKQIGCAGSKLSLPLQVQVMDQYDRPLRDQKVKFDAAPGNGSLNAGRETIDSVLTDPNGVAQVEWSLDAELAEQRIEASLLRRIDVPKVVFTAIRLLPQIDDSIDSVNFKTTSIRDSTSQTYTIYNPSACTLVIDSLKVLSEGPQSFSLVDQPRNAPIAPRKNLSVRIKFRPKVRGARLGTLRILNNASNQKQFDVKLRGTASADTVPPPAPIRLALTPETQKWQNQNQFTVTWMNPFDSSGIDSAYYKIGSAPKFNADRHGAWTTSQVVQRIDGVGAKMPGKDSLFVWLVDKFGNADHKKAAFVIIAFDNVQPDIETKLKTEARVRRPVSIAVEATDLHSGIKTVEFYYRRGGMPNFAKSSLLKGEATIPGDSVTARGLDYFVVATDTADNYTVSPDPGKFHSVQVQLEGGELEVIHLGGERAIDYRVRSFPLLLDDATIQNAFGQDFEFRDSTFQRLWDVDPARANSSSIFREFPQVGYPYSGKVSPGRAMLLIARHTVTINSPKGYTARTDKPFAIPLHKGWNLVASPFSFSIPVRNSNLPQLRNYQLYAFHGAWQPIVDLNAKFEPWEGLLLKVNEADPEVEETDPDTLFITPSEKVSDMMLKAGDSAHVAGTDWFIRINALSGDAKDIINTIGVAPDAAPGWDAYEFLEPPFLPSGDNVMLYFSQFHWSHYRDLYTTDFRPPSAEGYEWRFQVQTNRRGKDVDLQFENIHAVPAEWSVQLIDSVLNLPIDLRQQPFYSFRASEIKNHSRVFQLVVGNDQYVGKRLEKVVQTPSQFELLQNFPNPFNAVTMFRFGVPKTVRVSLVIYNIKGETVRTLIDEQEKKAGPYAALWDGRDHNGNPVATGVYIYQLKAENFVLAKKMVLAK